MEGLETRIARDPETGKNYKVPASMKYADWYAKYVKAQENQPAFSIIHETERVFTKEEIETMAAELKQVVAKHVGVKSKWSGNIVFLEGVHRYPYGKLWNCDISTIAKTSPHIILHEMLHSCSISYYDKHTFRKFTGIEEATVQFMTQEICKQENIELIESGYDYLVDGLRSINSYIKFGSDYDFAKKLIETPVVDRLDWLEQECYARLMSSGSTVAEYEDIQGILSELYDYQL